MQADCSCPQLFRLMLFLFLLLAGNPYGFAQQDESNPEYAIFKIRPSLTDATITNADTPHLVTYFRQAKRQGKLMVFLTGTGGIATKGPRAYFKTVIEQRYRLISLSYIDVPAIAEVCDGHKLKQEPECADAFRMWRVYGRGTFSRIDDQPQDAIVNRLTKLLQYLVRYDPAGNWGYYLQNDTLRWSEIAFSGQSQGGGMAEYIGKHQRVYRVIAFSGGWDWGPKRSIPDWYGTANLTPAESWYATYNESEPFARELRDRYRALNIPEHHIYKLNMPVEDAAKSHSDGIRNLAYKPIWAEMLGWGN